MHCEIASPAACLIAVRVRKSKQPAFRLCSRPAAPTRPRKKLKKQNVPFCEALLLRSPLGFEKTYKSPQSTPRAYNGSLVRSR